MGPTAIARLTLSEIRQLYRGFRIQQELEYDQQHGISSEERQGFEEFIDDLDGESTGSRQRGVEPTPSAPGGSKTTPPGYAGSADSRSQRTRPHSRQRRR